MNDFKRLTTATLTQYYIQMLFSIQQQNLKKELYEEIFALWDNDKEFDNILKVYHWCATNASEDSAAARLLVNLVCVGWEIFIIRFPLDQQIVWLEKAIKATENCPVVQPQDKVTIIREKAALLHYLASANVSNNNPDRALEFARQALALGNEIGDTEITGGVRGNIGRIYLNLGKTEQAIEFLEDAIKTYETPGPNRPNRIGPIYNDLGSAYSQNKDYEKALEKFDQALKYCRKINAKNVECIVLANKGNALMHLERLNEADECCKNALNISSQINDTAAKGLALCLKIIIRCIRDKDNPPMSDDLDTVISILEQSGNKFYLDNFLKILKKIYAQ